MDEELERDLAGRPARLRNELGIRMAPSRVRELNGTLLYVQEQEGDQRCAGKSPKESTTPGHRS